VRFGVLNRLLKPLNITTIYYLAVFIKLVLLAKHERGGERERLRGHHLRIAWGQAAEEEIVTPGGGLSTRDQTRGQHRRHNRTL